MKKEPIKLSSYDDIFGNENEKQEGDIVQLEISTLQEAQDHPFIVKDNEDMELLAESISLNGVLTPILVRALEGNNLKKYEIIAGHRRVFASTKKGLKTISGTIKDVSQNQAIIMMVDTNIQREKLLPSEKAFSYKMKLEAMKAEPILLKKEKSGRTDQALAKEVGESRAKIQRYIRLTYLCKELLNLVDDKRLTFGCGYELSYLPKDEQLVLYDYITNNNLKINEEQAIRLRDYNKKGYYIQNAIDLEFIKKPVPEFKKLVISQKKIQKYFPKNYSQDDIEKVVDGLLKEWADSKK